MMRLSDIKKSVAKILEKPDDEPKNWHCCDKLVRPSELHAHYMQEHWGKKA